MLDGATVFILHLILKLCPVGSGYGVLETAEVLLNSPKNLNLTEQKVSDSIKLLSGLGYVNLKYLSGKEYCLIPTQKARSYIEDIKRERLHDKKLNFSSLGWGFFGSFLGAFLGVILALIIFVG